MKGKLNLVEKEDVLKFISENGVKILNLCHIPEDGRLKTLSFSASDKKQVHQVLELGERVDGSSLFSYIAPDKSDIYITPKLNTAFLNPFSSEPTVNILSRYLDEKGKALDVAPENILHKAEQKLHSSANITLSALAELEFYIISKLESKNLFSSVAERHYHESAPFSKFGDLRNEILVTLADIGISTKYGHAEVGNIQKEEDTVVEQHEIELAPENLTRMADTIAVTKWVIRNVCAKHGVTVSFSPKISLEHAGSGMHIHLCGLRKQKNAIVDSEGNLSNEAKKMIGGILRFAPSLCAFGNTIPVSYLRFVSRKESPLHICWGIRNRLALIRIPLWWNLKKIKEEVSATQRTFEFRAPDASANAHLLFAGIAIAIEYGFSNSEKALRIAEELHIELGKEEKEGLNRLPQSCAESATNLENDREYYETDGVFSKEVIDGTIRKLRSYKDKALSQRLRNEPRETQDLMHKYLHYG
jgi:glutamine synthetase